MAELDITQEQFLDACEKAESDPKHKKIVGQIMAVENFIAFKKLMIKRNTELNEEALKMMLQKEKEQLLVLQKIQDEQAKKVKAAQDKPVMGVPVHGAPATQSSS